MLDDAAPLLFRAARAGERDEVAARLAIDGTALDGTAPGVRVVGLFDAAAIADGDALAAAAALDDRDPDWWLLAAWWTCGGPIAERLAVEVEALAVAGGARSIVGRRGAPGVDALLGCHLVGCLLGDTWWVAL